MRTSVISRSPGAAAALITVSAFALFLGYLAYTTVVFATAETLASFGSLDRAIALSPNNSKLHIQRGSPVALNTAARLAPASSTPHLRLALEAETSGNQSEALRHLETAAALDRGFAPRWALANYHFRAGQLPQFWQAARQAAAVYEGDLTALYRLCLHTGATGGDVYQRLAPARTKAIRELLAVLVTDQRLEDAIAPAVALADAGRAKDKELLLHYCDQLVEARQGSRVARLSAALSRYGASGGRCLEWRHVATEGVSTIRLADQSIQLELTGRQSDETLMLRRFVVLKPGRHYRLRYRVQPGSDALLDAVSWIWNGKPAGTLRQEPVWIHATDGDQEQLGELQLVARRAPGQRRAEGSLEIDRIVIEPVVVE